MKPLLHLRALTAADLPFADALREAVGWNQTREDWQRFIALEPRGCFLAEWDGAPAGTATTLVYGPELGWIGMVLVHPDYRHRGIGRALLLRCLDHLRAGGVRAIKLDATPLGRPVYEGLGFKPEWTLARWEHDGLPLGEVGATCVRSWQQADLGRTGALDAAAFGVSRQRLVAALLPQSRCGQVREAEAGRLSGYGLLRRGARALYLGPIAAVSAEAGLAVVQSLLATSGAERVFWDIPDPNARAVAWAEARGFRRQRPLTRMVLGENRAAGDPERQFALAGPEVG